MFMYKLIVQECLDRKIDRHTGSPVEHLAMVGQPLCVVAVGDKVPRQRVYAKPGIDGHMEPGSVPGH